MIIAIGDLLEDIVVWAPDAVSAGTDNPSEIQRGRGGSAANFASAVAAAGEPARFIGRVGDDAIGVALADDLAATGVEVRLQRGGRTGCVVVIVGADGDRTMFPDRAAASELAPIDPAWLAGAAVLHLPLYGFLDEAPGRQLRDAADVVRGAGGAITLDLSATSAIEMLGPRHVSDIIDQLAPTIVFGNVAEAASAGLHDRRPLPGGAFVIKAGGRPATVVHDDGRSELIAPSTRRAPRDTTGAGDAFGGAFVARWRGGDSLSAACAAGHAAAARTLATAGAAAPTAQ